MRYPLLSTVIFLIALTPALAHTHYARHVRYQHYHVHRSVHYSAETHWSHTSRNEQRDERRETYDRPSDCRGIPWCGCFMRHLTGLMSKSLNLAANWARVGVRALPGPNVIVVWRHHVGMIESQVVDGRAIVLSGNDGGRVRERERSLRGAIAFRSLDGASSSWRVASIEPRTTSDAYAWHYSEPRDSEPREHEAMGFFPSRDAFSAALAHGEFHTHSHAHMHKRRERQR